MARRFLRMRVNEVSSVDKGAGRGVQVVIVKRDEPAYDLTTGLDALSAGTQTYLKREFTADERSKLAESGKAMPNGGFPIETVADLENAVQAFGWAKNPDAAKAHIIARARALKAIDKLPDAWDVKKHWLPEVLKHAAKLIGLGKAEDFNEAQAAIEAGEYASGMIDEVQEAIQAVQASVCSIMCDDSITDKQAAIDETFRQFKQHIQGVVPEGVEEAMRGAALAAAGYEIDDQGAVSKREVTDMTDVEKAKKEAEDAKAEKEKVEKALLVAKRELSVLKMSDKHKAYVAARGDDMSQDEKDKFTDMEPAERDAHMEKNPVKEDVEKRQAAAIDAAIAKALQSHPEVVALRKQVADLTGATAATGFAKRAEEIGMPADFGATIMKAHNGDRAAVDELVKRLGAANSALEASGAFQEFGSRIGKSSDDPVEQLTAKAAELRKAHPELSQAQAFTKVYEDPANADLVKAERKAHRPAAG